MKTPIILLISVVIGLTISLLTPGIAEAASAASQAQNVSARPNPQTENRTPDYAVPPANAAANMNPATAQDLALAMGINSNDIVVATIGASDPLGTEIGSGPLSYFPTQGSTFAILSTGLASSAATPNLSGGLSYELGGLNNSQGNDLVQLTLRLRVPNDKNCMGFDFAYYSEEFPEFVGSIFNDTFTAEFNGSNLSILGNEVVAPLNFAFDISGAIISVNTVVGVTGNTGTTYDGSTPLLTAKQKVPPGQTITVVFSVQDLGDSIYDSAVFLDNFRWSNDSDCGAGSQSKPPLLLVHGWQGLVKTDLGTGSGFCTAQNANIDVVRLKDVLNKLPKSVQYWAEMPLWFESGGGVLDDTVPLYYDAWVAQLKTGSSQGTPSIHLNAQCLRYQIDHVYSRNRQPVTIVAHSMGGLVSRAALLDPSTRNKVKTLYTIQTPHAGLPSAYIGCSHQQIGACEMEIDNMKSNFNPVVKNQRGTNYVFIGSDYSPFFNTYFGSGKHDGLVGSNSGVGWNDAGKFEPAGWISNSPPVQFVTDEVHSERYKKEVVFNSFRSIGNSIELSQSYRCIKYWMNDAKPPFSIVPSYCRLPSTSVVATNLDGTAQDPTQLIMHVSGHIGPTQTAEESASIDPTDATMFSLAWTTGTLDFVLISPNGELVDPTFANSHPNLVSYTHHVGSADAGPIASYLLAGAMPGLWRMRITAVGIEMSGVDYDLFVTAQTKRTLTAQMNKQSYDLGETATIIATLQQDGVGFYDATVVANAKRSDGVIDTLLLADQGNGVYSAAYEIPSAAGFLPISIIASGVDNNVPFTRQATILAIVRPSDARLTGSYIELPKDENNDSLYEGLDFLISVTATSPQNYGLLAGLEKNGQPITFAVQDVVLVPGEQVVTIRFDGNDIRRSQLDGPYTVSNLSLFDKDLGVPAQFFESAWVTEPYNFHDFGACHSLTIVQNPSFGGTINTSPTPNCNNGTQYSVDTEVALTAAPNSGYIFTNWIAAASGTSNPIQVVMDNDKTVAANFLEITWSEPAVITMTADPVEIAADGTSISTIMVTIMDANGNVIPIQNVTFETTLGTLSTISETTNSAGVVTVALTSSASGMAIVTAKAGAAIGTVQVNLIAPYIPGDCNNDQTVGAADLTALALEFFDGDDNNDPNDTPNGAYPGTPACDANEDGRIGASDLTCIALIFFNGPGACQVGQSAAAHSQPTLVIPDDLVAEAGGQVTVPIVLQGNGAEVSSLLFSIDYDERWLTIDPADHDEDGVPDAIVFNLPDHFVRSVTIDLNDASGELDIMIASFASPAHVLPEGELLSITFGLGNSADTTEATIAFAQQPEPSLGDRSGHAISGSAQDGAVRIVATGESGSASVLHLPMISR